MPEDRSQYDEEGNGHLNNREQDKANHLDREKNPLPENITEYIQKARDELKQYEEEKKFYEKRRKKEIVLELIDLLEEHDYPKDFLRLIIAQELGDYISTSYIEKILAERYPVEKKIVKEQSTRQTEEIPQIDDRIAIELSTTGENIIESGNADPHDTNRMSIEASSEPKTELELQVEKGRQEIIKTFEDRIKVLETKCYQLDQLAREGSMWKERYTRLQQEFRSFKNKIIKGTTEIEFGSEFLPIEIEYSLSANKFEARIPKGVIDRILEMLRRHGSEQ